MQSLASQIFFLGGGSSIKVASGVDREAALTGEMTDAMPAAPQRIIRKAAYGRTQLFLPSTGAVLREVKCMGGLVRHNAASVYHVLPSLDDRAVSCWHCCEPIAQGAPWVPLPRLYDATEGVFHVYGKTCSPACAKGYILEHTTFDRGQHLNVLVKMLRELYGVHGPVVATPPRPALRRFGGVFDPTPASATECRLVEPPFVSYCMLVDECLGHSAVDPAVDLPSGPSPVVEEAHTLDEPPPPGLFAGFVDKMSTDAAPPAAGEGVAKRTRVAPAGDRQIVGPMAKFIRKS